MFYRLFRPLLFSVDPENAHDLTISALRASGSLLGALAPAPVQLPVEIMGLVFPNPVGLAAGMDKNGEAIDGLATLGFGFIEAGTVTPRPQAGNPRPRLFRLPKASAIINRMGFNNAGVDVLVRNVQGARFKGILGINIGKNADTPIDRAAGDFIACLDKVYPHAGYVAVNISSPNTKNLRDLQGPEALDDLLARLKIEQARLADRHGRYVPITLKIAPDLDDVQITLIADLLRQHHFDGLIAGNTTISRHGVSQLRHGGETGGLSGAPLMAASTGVLREFAIRLAGEIPLIGVGGIVSGEDAAAKFEAGANLVQVYTGLIYRGPELVTECIDALRERIPAPA